jgi:hypothetical protein
MGSFPDDANGVRDILDSLEQAYRDVTDPPRPDLVKVVQEWRKLVE